MNRCSLMHKKTGFMVSCRSCCIEAPRADSLHSPGVQNLSLCCTDRIHMQQGLGSLHHYVRVTVARSQNFAHSGGVLAAL